jgi:hypothetical protein
MAARLEKSLLGSASLSLTPLATSGLGEAVMPYQANGRADPARSALTTFSRRRLFFLFSFTPQPHRHSADKWVQRGRPPPTGFIFILRPRYRECGAVLPATKRRIRLLDFAKNDLIL